MPLKYAVLKDKIYFPTTIGTCFQKFTGSSEVIALPSKIMGVCFNSNTLALASAFYFTDFKWVDLGKKKTKLFITGWVWFKCQVNSWPPKRSKVTGSVKTKSAKVWIGAKFHCLVMCIHATPCLSCWHGVNIREWSTVMQE